MPFIHAFGQEKRVFTVDWIAPLKSQLEGQAIDLPMVKNGGYDNRDLRVAFQESLDAKSNYSVRLLGHTTQPINEVDRVYLQRTGIEVPESFQPEVKIAYERGKPFLVAVFFPYYKKSSSIVKVMQIEVELKREGSVQQIQAKSFAASSVLASGTFYKVAVTNDGLYKIDKAFLESIGISTTGLNPNHLHVFGNGAGPLSSDNSKYRPDDLVNNAIEVVGGQDGSFDNGDYLLFYGYGPHRWDNDGTSGFTRTTNVYSDESYYFITVNGQIPPVRIQNLPNENLTHNGIISTFHGRQHLESDLINLVGGGQRWYGDEFDVQLSRTYTFSFPNAVAGSNAQMKYAFAARKAAGNNIKVSNNGVLWDDNSSFNFEDFSRTQRTLTQPISSGNFSLNFNFTRANASVKGYLDFITLTVEQQLTQYTNVLPFRSLRNIGVGNVSQFDLSNGGQPNIVIWDVTHRNEPKRVNTTTVGSIVRFTVRTDSIREFVSFYGNNFPSPTFKSTVANQNLHALGQTDIVLLTHGSFTEQANRLAQLHRSEGYTVHVVAPDRVFNEFSSGMQDPVAIRQFMRMFYKRGLANGTQLPKYLILFGDGTWDPKNKVSNANYILTYQETESESLIKAIVSDDFFGFLDDNESFSDADLLDLGIGRLLVSSTANAKQIVDKIEHYHKDGSNFYANPGDCDCPQSATLNTFGDWRTKYVQIADDQENGYFIHTDVEPQVSIVANYRPEMNADKIYLDAFQQISTAGGQRYPDAFNAINDRVRRGALVVNYVGHGGEVGAAAERVITVEQILGWRNNHALPLIVSATCEFTRFDDPNRVSAGEWALLNPKGGAIGLMTTTRSVYFDVNTVTGRAFFSNVFRKNSDSLPRTFGDIIQRTKNDLALSIGSNKRAFTLIGDPALRLALPQFKMVVDSVYRDGQPMLKDTIRALDKVKIVGHVEDQQGNVMTQFNGIASPTIYDKPKMFKTLGQDGDSPVIEFELQKNALFKGKASITNGYFSMQFVVPKDIDYSYGYGKISLYGNDEQIDGMGFDSSTVIGGVNPNGIADNVGPELQLFMNDESFVDGGITDETPLFIAKVFDENGINAVGNGIGHDITLVLDGNEDKPFLLNEYYESALDDYTRGRVEFRLPPLEVGEHVLRFKIWDVNNNSSEQTLNFTVKAKEKPELAHVLNYPNPFTTRTSFFFEHNQVNTNLETQIQIFTVSGRLVKTINQMVNSFGYRSAGIEWDGRDDFGDQLAKGVYVYRLKIRTPDGQVAEKFEKLVLLK